MQSMSQEDRTTVAEAAKMWWIFLVAGIAWMLIATSVLRMDVNSIETVGILIGALFMIAAINEFAVARMATGGWKLVSYIIAIILVLGAMEGFFRPINTFFALASVLGLILTVMGIADIARGLTSKGANDLWWVALLSGIFQILLALWVSGSDRLFLTAPSTAAGEVARRSAVILFWVGFMALFRGIANLTAAFALKRAGKMAAAA